MTNDVANQLDVKVHSRWISLKASMARAMGRGLQIYDALQEDTSTTAGTEMDA
jgi:hypothetical protein